MVKTNFAKLKSNICHLFCNNIIIDAKYSEKRLRLPTAANLADYSFILISNKNN